MSEPSSSVPMRRAAVAFIFVTVMLDMLALGMVIPVLPKLIEAFRGGDTARAATTLAVFGTVWGAMQFFAAPVLGSLSDRFGRRPVVLTSNFGLGFDYILMALAPTLNWLFVGRVISGITAASIPAAFAYIADVTPVEGRAKSFGLMGAAFGIGFVVGPVLGGVLSRGGPRLPFWVAAALSLTNAMYGLFVLPESLPHERRMPFSWRRANPWGALRLLRTHRQLLGFASVHFLYYMAHQSLQNVFVLYTGYRYGWDTFAVGLALGAVGVTTSIVQGGLVGPIVARFGERRTLIIGLCFGVTAFLIYALAPTGGRFALGILVMSLWGLYGPSAQGLMTRRVSPSEQGQLQGALSSVVTMTGIVGPTIFSLTFATFIGSRRDWHLPGAPFLLAAALLVVAIVVVTRITRPQDSGAAQTAGAVA
ncbi:MAG TPA: TCR/Tet family MFS transporter [Vicinamibacterales bacterium]|nr:TCR/Tet family MFS transporter [Vicinamibacterales bacterium]